MRPDPEADDTPSGGVLVYVFLALCIAVPVRNADRENELNN
jgi:hypothetical protein